MPPPLRAFLLVLVSVAVSATPDLRRGRPADPVPPVVLRGTVVDALDGRPVGGAIVRGDGRPCVVTTRVDGTFAIAGMPGDVLTVQREDGPVARRRVASEPLRIVLPRRVRIVFDGLGDEPRDVVVEARAGEAWEPRTACGLVLRPDRVEFALDVERPADVRLLVHGGDGARRTAGPVRVDGRSPVVRWEASASPRSP